MPRRSHRSERPARSSGPRPLSLAVTLLGTALLWLFLGPVQLGGDTAYSVISGTSMEPLLHRGDLAAVRGDASYDVGDVALYRSEDMKGQRVLHRIIGVGDGSYTFKGDNNDFVDPETVDASALEGRLWFHASSVGSAMTWIREPWRAATIAATTAALALGSRLGVRTHRRRRHARPQHAMGHQHEAARLRTLWAPAAVGLVVVVAVAGAGFTNPLTTGIAEDGAFRHEGTFSYSAELREPNSAFPSGEATTGQPVFFALSEAVQLDFAYRFVSPYEHDVKGTVVLKALVSDATGWRELFDVSAPVDFDGTDLAVIGGDFPLDALQELVAQLAANSGLPSAEYVIYLQPTVTLTGTLQGRPITSTFSPVLPISVTQALMRVASTSAAAVPGGTSAPAADVFHPVLEQRAAVTGANTLTIARYDIAIRTIRVLTFVLLGAWLISLLVLARRARVVRDNTAIAAGYGDTIVPVGSLDELTTARPTVSIADFEDLAKLASELEEPLLAETTDDVVRYAVATDALVYLHEPVAQDDPFAALPPGREPPARGTARRARHAETVPAFRPRSRWARLPAVGGGALRFGPLLLPLVVLGSILMSFTATSLLPTSYAGVSNHPVMATQLAPGDCPTLAPTKLVIATGVAVTGTSANDLLLGLGTTGTKILIGADGNDCIVAGGTGSTRNRIDGGAGTDFCSAPSASITTFENCEYTFTT